MKTRYTKTVLAGAIALTMCAGLSPPAFAYTTTHNFTLNDVTGGFDGSTYADDSTILCTDHATCNVVEDKTTHTVLFPIDSEFGFYVEDFVGTEQKVRDGDYAEGWVGEVKDEGENIVGLMVSNAATDKFKVKYPMGTWCAGLGGNSVKCSTEHYTVLEAVMTCNETVPYWYTSGDGSIQANLSVPGSDPPVALVPAMSCANGALDDMLYNVLDGAITADPLVPDPATDNTLPLLEPNESYVLFDIAVSNDYAMTKKDDGKPLYRFGNMVKRPNDIRLYARMELPAEWKAEGADFKVTKALLTIEHNITNNPNDQIRPEDMENEGATGRTPEANVGGAGLISANDCFEGDGDPIPWGTVFRNDAAALGEATVPVTDYGDKPYPYSEDLVFGLTNAWYTSTDRDPFANVESVDIYAEGEVGDPGDIAMGGPRWRLRPNKFGQDIPGLEVPRIACSPVPYSHSNIRYEVGELTTMTINLLDWEEGEAGSLESPLASSRGWVDASANVQNYTEGEPGEFLNTNGNATSINGVPMTEDFDLAVYVKGDRKATALYTATLDIEYEGEVTPEFDYDLELVSVDAPASAAVGDPVIGTYTVRNNGAEIASGGSLTIVIVDTSLGDWGAGIVGWLTVPVPDLATGEEWSLPVPWTVWTHSEPPVDILWGGVVSFDADELPDNNQSWVEVMNVPGDPL